MLSKAALSKAAPERGAPKTGATTGGAGKSGGKGAAPWGKRFGPAKGATRPGAERGPARAGTTRDGAPKRAPRAPRDEPREAPVAAAPRPTGPGADLGAERVAALVAERLAARAAENAPPVKGARRPAKGGRPKAPMRAVGLPGADGKGGSVSATEEGPIRVQRALARAGIASRREADKAVADGRVRINGEIALIGQLVDPAVDKLTLDGETVSVLVTSHRWIVLNKPARVMTTRKDPEGRPTVFDLVRDVAGLVYVGRLDFMTEGVLLLTTDGRAAHALTHPSREVERTYMATVQGDAVTAAREARRGVQLEDGLVVPREVLAHPMGQRRWGFEITITEGKTHEVRRICDVLGLEVERLVRTSFGPIRLGPLEPGETRALTPKEREMIEALIASDVNAE